jgi:hypothetical protein
MGRQVPGTIEGLIACAWVNPQVRLDLGLTSPQAQWLARGGSSGYLRGGAADTEAGEADPVGGSGSLDSPFKHRWGFTLRITCMVPASQSSCWCPASLQRSGLLSA